MVSAYYDLLTSEDEVARMRAAEAWSVWEGRTSTLQPDEDLVAHFGSPYHALAMARIECHYFKNHSFIEPNQILDNAHYIEQISTTIIHGHYDMVCPVNQAYALASKLPKAMLKICHHSGHSAMELEIAQHLVQATDDMLNQV